MEENTGREVKKFLLKDEELTQVTGGMGNFFTSLPVFSSMILFSFQSPES